MKRFFLFACCCLFIVSCDRKDGDVGISDESDSKIRGSIDSTSVWGEMDDTIVFRHISMKKHRSDGSTFDLNYEYPVQGPESIVSWINNWLTVQAVADSVTPMDSPDQMSESALSLRKEGVASLDDALTKVTNEQVVRVIAAESGHLLYGIIIGGERRNMFIDLHSCTGHLLRPVDVFKGDSWTRIRSSLRRPDVKSIFLGKQDVVFVHSDGGWGEHVSYDRLWNDIEPKLRTMLQNKVTSHYVFIEQVEKAVKQAQDNFEQKPRAQTSVSAKGKFVPSGKTSSFRKDDVRDEDDVNYLYTPEGKLEMILHTCRSRNGDVTTSIYNGQGDYQGKEVTSYASGKARTVRYNRNNQVRK